LQAVDEQRQVRALTGGAPASAVGDDGRDAVVVHQIGVVEQSSHQSALAIVNAAAGDEAQQVAPFRHTAAARVLAACNLGARKPAPRYLADTASVAGHQKYPWRFLASMLPT